MTEKLYYIDSRLFDFTAMVLSCAADEGRFAVTLDRSAFFPEGGGQLADTGYIGTARLTDVQELGGEMLHYVDSPLSVGQSYTCKLDREVRLRRMQNHSGEHIVSGIAHKLFGVNNIGFHMGEQFMTIDFDRELQAADLVRIETLANEAVRENLPITAFFPSEAELQTLSYRSKLELSENLRLVSIEGIDLCACCAPHMRYTGEVGIIKLLESERHRGGTRLSLVCGMDALDLFRRRQNDIISASSMLSSKRDETVPAISRILQEQQNLKAQLHAVELSAVGLLKKQHENADGNICIFDNCLSEAALRELANCLTETRDGLVAIFSGSDGQGYRYTIASRNINLRAAAKDINLAINGKGGGRPTMIQGSASECAENIESYICCGMV